MKAYLVLLLAATALSNQDFLSDIGLGGLETILNPLGTSSNKNLVPIYQYHVVQNDGGWRLRFDARKDLQEGWTRDDAMWSAYSSPVIDSVPVYVYHLSQADGGMAFKYETSAALDTNGWVIDSVAWWGFDHYVDGSIPIYRYSATQPTGEKRYNYQPNNQLGQGWTFERVAFYALPAPSNQN